jgi:hypothetical protein
MKNRATQRRQTAGLDPQQTVLDFFFHRKQTEQGMVLIPKTGPVTREELWWSLEWVFARIRKRNAWWRRLWRLITRQAVVTYDPFQLAHARGGVKAEPPRPDSTKKIDATGAVVDA